MYKFVGLPTDKVRNILIDIEKDIISIDYESANQQQAKSIWSNYQHYWIKKIN